MIHTCVIGMGALVMGCQSGISTAPSLEVTAGDTVTIPSALKACPDSPNCVHSVESGRAAAPQVRIAGDAAAAQLLLERVIAKDGGAIMTSLPGFIWATYTSRIFRFKDDIELLLDVEAGDSDNTVFNVRSASRVGKSDLGVNLKRVERLIGTLDQSREQ